MNSDFTKEMNGYLDELSKPQPRPSKKYESEDGVEFYEITSSELGETCLVYRMPNEKRIHRVEKKSTILARCGEGRLKMIFGIDYDRIFK